MSKDEITRPVPAGESEGQIESEGRTEPLTAQQIRNLAGRYAVHTTNPGDLVAFVLECVALSASSTRPPDPARKPDPVGGITETETSYARRQGYAEGWNECLDALSAPNASSPPPDGEKK